MLDPTNSSAQVLRLGFVLVVSGPLSVGVIHFGCPRAVVGTSVRTKTTKRGMPWRLLAHGFLGSGSACWSLRFLSCLHQAISDTLALQPDRVLDFLPAVLSGTEDRPTFSEPWDRERFVPWLRTCCVNTGARICVTRYRPSSLWWLLNH